ncbi:uncharacterized protein EDB91DRAFT_1238309 [Suillus paluster]|uniref:uncharacterized protein n=1 Tax=Suillus paluster TaxID=48578 RepID=UPI001B87FC8C|nr:uncharacterized protein EDB91DRAFT_1238309 [Suillus paluster]KAG1735140.1 hypothetical protein EDB91DRAFT_1238309 [Suillus paluster]
MNFLDTYGLTGTGANTPPVNAHPEQSLNEEVSQVIGQLGKFWGGFRKQSETAFATARKDFSEVVTQAQRELGKLAVSTETPADTPADSHDDTEGASENEGESESHTAPETPTAESPNATGSLSTSQSIFARLQSSLPPNIVSTVQAQLPESLKHPQNIDLSQLRTTLSTEFQRVQGVTRAQAEEYVHKSEHLLREAMKEAGEVLRDAVKVIPPEESGGSSSQGLIWDGTDMWLLPMAEGGDVKGKGKETNSGPSSRRQSEDARQAVATRAQALLKQLKSNPEIIKLDPEADTSGETFHAWVSEMQSKDEHPGTKVWSERVASALSDTEDGQTLQETFDALVPSMLSDEEFWTRYFFRAYQIEQEEMRRKTLIHGTNQTEEDFSWEDDDDESVVPESRPLGALKSLASSQRTLAPEAADAGDVRSLPSSQFHTPMTMSPRESSEDSYDVVSGNVSAAGDVQEHAKQDEEEEEESDWE